MARTITPIPGDRVAGRLRERQLYYYYLTMLSIQYQVISRDVISRDGDDTRPQAIVYGWGDILSDAGILA